MKLKKCLIIATTTLTLMPLASATFATGSVYADKVISNQTQIDSQGIKFDKPEDVVNIYTKEDEEKFERSLETMSINELNSVIKYTSEYAKENKTSARAIVVPAVLKQAWKAAAQVARVSGYPLSATLVENSVDGNNYSETDGAFTNAIKSTNTYSQLSGSGSGSFEKSENADLFYALHAFDYQTNSNTLTITDTFDFKLETNYQDLFSTLVNNWGYLNENMNVLTPISIQINISQ